MLVLPGDQKNQTHTGANRAIGNIECRKTDFISAALLNVKINEVHDGVSAGQKPVCEISRDAAENESEGNLPRQFVRVEVMSREKQGDERKQRNEGECGIVAAKQTPRRAGVAPVNEFEETIDDDFFVARFEEVQHKPF